jgi:hypothetical protein
LLIVATAAIAVADGDIRLLVKEERMRQRLRKLIFDDDMPAWVVAAEAVGIIVPVLAIVAELVQFALRNP